MTNAPNEPLSPATLADAAHRWHIVCLAETGSTNDDAFAHAARHGRAAHGTVILADRQTAGRGRMGRTWHDAPGASVLASLLLIDRATDDAARLSLAAGVAVCEAIESSTPVRPRLRWPNDVFDNSRKLAGVLVERRTINGFTATVVGVGINVAQQQTDFPPELADRATSLQTESALPVDRDAVARSLLAALHRWFGDAPPTAAPLLLDEWRRRSDDIGTRVALVSDGVSHTGRILDVQPDAALLFEKDDGRRLSLRAATTTIVERYTGKV